MQIEVSPAHSPPWMVTSCPSRLSLESNRLDRLFSSRLQTNLRLRKKKKPFHFVCPFLNHRLSLGECSSDYLYPDSLVLFVTLTLVPRYSKIIQPFSDLDYPSALSLPLLLSLSPSLVRLVCFRATIIISYLPITAKEHFIVTSPSICRLRYVHRSLTSSGRAVSSTLISPVYWQLLPNPHLTNCS